VEVEKINKKYAEMGLTTWFIMIVNTLGKVPTKMDCKLFQNRQGHTARILFDPTYATAIYGNKETFFVTNKQAEITYKATKMNLQGIDDAISDLLTAP
jgi:hypothetical protein